MIYSTSGEFIQALRDYDVLKEKGDKWRDRYRDLYYQRYEKVRSPLDYDTYIKKRKGKNGEEKIEVLRQIKIGGTYSPEAIRIIHEQLEKDMEFALNEYSKIKVKLENTNDELKRISEPLRSILIMRYKMHMKLKEVCKKCDLYLDESGLYKYIHRELDKYYE